MAHLSALAPEFQVHTLRMRRRKLAKLIGTGTVIVYSGKQLAHPSATFRPDSNARYLCGWREPDGLLVMHAENGEVTREVMYCREQSSSQKTWEGRRAGTSEAVKSFGLEEAAAFTSIGEIAQAELDPKSVLVLDPAADPEIAREMMQAWTAICRSSRSYSGGIEDLRGYMDELRSHKSKNELIRMRSAAKTSARVLRHTIKRLSAFDKEFQIAAYITGEYYARGVKHAFNPIVACGANACALHYADNNAPLKRNRLVLIDTGCEVEGYASDVTRTCPVNGEFTDDQRKLYNIVLDAHDAALSKIKPRSTIQDAQKAANSVIARGLRKLGIIPASQPRAGQLDNYFMHGIGHFLGLDVHDPVDLVDDRGKSRQLELNMCLTIEPGIYLGNQHHIPASLRNTGIRIEDTVQVVRGSCEVLTSSVPTDPDAIENMIQQG